MPDQLFPTAAERTTLPSSAGTLAALIAAPTDAASARAAEFGELPSVLLLPGYTGSKEDFSPVLEPLAAAGIRAVAVDQPGQYESPGGDDEAAFRPAPLGAVAAELVTALAQDGPVVLLGHSYGGLVARQAVLQGAPVAGLVLLCSGPSAFTSGNRFDALTVGEPILRSQGAAFLHDARDRAAGLDPDRPDPLARFYRKRFLATATAQLLGAGAALLDEPDLTELLAAALRRHGTPAAVIAGEADDAWPLAAQRRMAEQLGTSLVLVPGGGHSPAVEAPEALLDVLLPLITDWTEPDRAA
ncbi:alpha/beta fold hydrolase [Nakamurella alba]|uniref:alpha/beta fold hydrolase n=1 Tax=Nakamurella alba TaxID=2665158 RepID=UPI002AC34F5B|nr:alpha/beta hydrolase [Nakamurella alba]